MAEASEKVLTVPSQTGEPWRVSRGACELALFWGRSWRQVPCGGSGQAEDVGYSGRKDVRPQNKIHIRLQPFFFFLIFIEFGSAGKESTCHAGDPGSIPGSGRFPWRRDIATHSSILAWRRGPWWATVQGVAESWTGLSN